MGELPKARAPLLNRCRSTHSGWDIVGWGAAVPVEDVDTWAPLAPARRTSGGRGHVADWWVFSGPVQRKYGSLVGYVACVARATASPDGMQ